MLRRALDLCPIDFMYAQFLSRFSYAHIGGIT